MNWHINNSYQDPWGMGNTYAGDALVNYAFSNGFQSQPWGGFIDPFADPFAGQNGLPNLMGELNTIIGNGGGYGVPGGPSFGYLPVDIGSNIDLKIPDNLFNGDSSTYYNSGSPYGNPGDRSQYERDPVTGLRRKTQDPVDGGDNDDVEEVVIVDDPKNDAEKFDSDYLVNKYKNNNPEDIFKDKMLVGDMLKGWNKGVSWYPDDEGDYVQWHLVGKNAMRSDNVYDYLVHKFGEDKIVEIFGSKGAAEKACGNFAERLKENHTDFGNASFLGLTPSEFTEDDLRMEYAKLSADDKYEVITKDLQGNKVTYDVISTYNRDFMKFMGENVDKVILEGSDEDVDSHEINSYKKLPDLLGPTNSNALDMKIVMQGLKSKGRSPKAGCTEAEYLAILYNAKHGESNGYIQWWKPEFKKEITLVRDMHNDWGTDRNPRGSDFLAYVQMYDEAKSSSTN